MSDEHTERDVLRSLALAFIVGIRLLETDGLAAFDPVEEIINEWYEEFGKFDPIVVQEMVGPLKQAPGPLSRQQRRLLERKNRK